jgi:hypothetical protein
VGGSAVGGADGGVLVEGAGNQRRALGQRPGQSFLRLPVMTSPPTCCLAAAATRQRFGISYRDAAIVEAARSLGRPVLTVTLVR